MVAPGLGFQHEHALARAEEVHFHPFDVGRPDPEETPPAPHGHGTEGRPPDLGRRAQSSPLRNTAPRGGKVRFTECGRPWKAKGTAWTPPMLPWPLPPYSTASLLKISCQKPPLGTPTR